MIMIGKKFWYAVIFLLFSNMEAYGINISLHLFLVLVFSLPSSTAPCTHHHDHIALCLTSNGLANFTTPHSQQYNHFLYTSIWNLVFTRPTFPRPIAIIFPQTKAQLTVAIQCSTQASLTIRLRSGGHSYEGISSTAQTPFVIIDLMSLHRVTVDLESETAWAESGATIGQIYRAIAALSPRHGFPAGFGLTVGSGGHISGGGYGMLTRMYGLAADNVIDAILIDADGRSFDREAMGEDVFWAVRGGGGGNWGAVYSWKIRLLPVPENVTAFIVTRSGNTTQVAELIHKWQLVSPELDDEFYLLFTATPDSENRLVSVMFQGFHAAPKASTRAILTRVFPELGLEEDECNEMSWIEAVVFFSGLEPKEYSKIKGDVAREPIPLEGLKGAMEWLVKEPRGGFGFTPGGGIMRRIRSDAIPYPHRAGSLFNVIYYVSWQEEDDGRSERYIDWIRGLYDYMTPFVSKDPRVSEVNELDLDYGVMDWENVGLYDAWKVAKRWGERYFMGNYERLVRAKTLIDPNNVFRHPQSIPPLPATCLV